MPARELHVLAPIIDNNQQNKRASDISVSQRLVTIVARQGSINADRINKYLDYRSGYEFRKNVGAQVPRCVAKRLGSYSDDQDAIRSFGLDVVTQLCEQLVKEGAPGMHFYTLNAAAATKAICERLG